MACEENNHPKVVYDIFENHDISACGVSDPLQNIEWLSEFCKRLKTQDILSVHIELYKVTGKGEHVFRINSSFPFESTPEQGNVGYLLEWKDCAGNMIFYVPYPGTPPDPVMVENFMRDKEFVSELFHFIKQ